MDEISLETYQSLMDRRPKYGNRKVERDGYRFDSQAEANEYLILKSRAQAGEIRCLVVHPKPGLLLQEGFLTRDNARVQPIWYKPDFTYLEGDREVICEVKGKETDVWRIKRKLLLKRYPDACLRVVKV